ncbi:hypothetical protein [Enterococcus columbae]|uniref:Uncharacterized protein n=1 Tax=Enterococcus columbae DSM 7374 = ATCC 51263 TaxID=1121865 RepID=S1NPB2_9ENTE|nr:hypothetical protein [Enterococcus columbae]EOT42506.1 hypothetical protein OMW_00984 [Enterococcus columbae DSM 7374 = ATCC 51263]EOW87558.1 hypothetical protein I568_00223 [Enterococcus columbae DSM 7374 = ATCC 51263]OJG23112.1 hypothetical protein RR47_GL000602 [Enterococcus columbae DSM 7374 = ATCC 51263]
MDKQQLDALPLYVQKALHPDFVFLIQPNLIQHFPARNWQREQFLTALDERLGEKYRLSTWHGYAVAIAEEKDCIAIIPKFEHL